MTKESEPLTLTHLIQTPTVAFTSSGVLCVILWGFRVPYADVAAFLFFLLAGGGVAMALGNEVTRKGFKWGWKGVIGAIFRRPSTELVVGVVGHIVQLLAALSIALIWRHRKKGDEEDARDS